MTHENTMNELEVYMELEEALLEISKSIILDPNVFYAGNPFTNEQRSELRLQRLKDLGLWPVKSFTVTPTPSSKTDIA